MQIVFQILLSFFLLT